MADKHALRYMALGQAGQPHKFLQYFIGHTARVTTVALNPKNDTLLSAAQVGMRAAFVAKGRNAGSGAGGGGGRR